MAKAGASGALEVRPLPSAVRQRLNGITSGHEERSVRAAPAVSPGSDEPEGESKRLLDALRLGVDVAGKKRQAIEAVQARQAGKDRAELRSMLEQELDRRGIARDPTWVEEKLDELESSETERAQQMQRSRAAAVRTFGKLSRALRRETQARADRVVPAAFAALAKAGQAPEWMAVPGGSLYPSVPGVGAEKRAVRVGADAGPMLEQVFISMTGRFGGSRAVFEVWFSPAESDPERVAVHVGKTCVGTLDRDTSDRLRPVMEVAERRGLRQSRAKGTATLTRAKDFSPPFLLVVRVPGSGPATRLGEYQ